MTSQFCAVYEHGILKPTAPIAVAEGARVELLILSSAAMPTLSGQRTPAEILAGIAALPLESGGQEFAGREHDKILYGERGAK